MTGVSSFVAELIGDLLRICGIDTIQCISEKCSTMQVLRHYSFLWDTRMFDQHFYLTLSGEGGGIQHSDELMNSRVSENMCADDCLQLSCMVSR